MAGTSWCLVQESGQIEKSKVKTRHIRPVAHADGASPSLPPDAPSAPVATAHDGRGSRIALLLLLVLLFVAYAGLAWLSSGSEKRWMIDVIANVTVLNGDDAYRFFLARSAWLDLSLYAYNYLLPVALMLDGVLSILLSEGLLAMRIAHAMVSVGALWLIYRTGRHLAIPATIMLLGCAVMGLLPLYAMVSLSFYGEVWLGFFLCLTTYAFVRQQWLLMAVAASVLPLTRPEGIFFFIPLWLYIASRRRFDAAALMVVPGMLYVMFLLGYLDNLSDYSYWRIELRKIYEKIVLIPDQWAMAKTYSPLWLLPATLGFLYRPIRTLWPIYTGALLWLLILIITVKTNQAFYEPRYTYTLIPFIGLLWAAAASWFVTNGGAILPSALARRIFVPILALGVMASHVNQITALVIMKEREGAFWVARKVLQGEWGEIFPFYNKARLIAMDNAANRIYYLLDRDDSIDQLIVYDFSLYYALSPGKIKPHVKVGYPVVSQLVADMLLKGQVFTQHPGGRMFSYFWFNKPLLGQRARRVLYAEQMGGLNYPYVWTEGPHEIYLFSYKESWTPSVDLSKAPMIDQAMAVDEYYRSFGPAPH